MTGTVNDEEIQILLDGLVHDRVAIQYQLMHDLLNGQTDERYILFDIDEFKTLIVKNVGERDIKTPGRQIQCRGHTTPGRALGPGNDSVVCTGAGLSAGTD